MYRLGRSIIPPQPQIREAFAAHGISDYCTAKTGTPPHETSTQVFVRADGSVVPADGCLVAMIAAEAARATGS